MATPFCILVKDKERIVANSEMWYSVHVRLAVAQSAWEREANRGKRTKIRNAMINLLESASTAADRMCPVDEVEVYRRIRRIPPGSSITTVERRYKISERSDGQNPVHDTF
ncbi:hypothetical protein J2X83_006000 [Brevibacillus nitrificans]|nr:hypothetical protein [Brevibacillus nitrificans]